MNHVDKKIEKTLANIVPCTPAELAYIPLDEAFYYLNIHSTHGFTWHREIIGERFYDSDTIRPTGGATNLMMMYAFDALKQISAYIAKNRLKAALEAEIPHMVVEANEI